jgi:isoquinoline 1-oxidoreductase beta subunit
MITRNISRRDFVKLTGMSGAVLALGYYLPADGRAPSIVSGEAVLADGIQLNSWIAIDATGKITLTNHRAEMGQGAYQAVPSMLAEELEVDLDKVKIVFAPGNSKRYGSQVTGGSSTVRGSYIRLSKLAASAREMLIEAAAAGWKTDRSSCYAEDGKVIHRPSGKSVQYGDLVAEAAKLTPPADVELKPRKDYKILRKPLPRQDTPMKVNGSAIFGLDKKLPGMLYASVERNPRFVGKVKSFDATAARAVPGVKHVMKVTRSVFARKHEGVAVVADSLWAATQGRKALQIEWDDTGFEHYSTDQLFEKLREQLNGDAISFKTKGNAGAEFEKSTRKIEAIYETPYEAHSCMEPLNCVAHVHDDKCEIWGPIQAPDWIQEDLSKELGLPMENVIVNMTFLGGGFGRKAFMDYPQEAALISKEVKAPVQVIWTREDDTTQGPFRPGMVYKCQGGLTEDGSIRSFDVKMSGQNMDHQWPGADKSSYNGSVTEGLPEAYADSLPHYSFGDVPLDAPIPVMWWRSVYSSTNGFAFESFIDELAVAAGKDPLDFRRGYLHDARYQELIKTLEEKSGWKSRKKNEGWGVAVTECFASIVGEVVKVSKKADGGITIDKVFAVMDCGWYVNPDIIKAQIEGSIVMGLGAATTHETLFEDGKAVQDNFHTYRMPRLTDIPEIEVHIMDNDEDAGGVGEPALPPFAPALCNAVFDLTGKRIRKLPFDLKNV